MHEVYRLIIFIATSLTLNKYNKDQELNLRNIRIHESNRTKFGFFYFLYITFYNLLPK